MIANRYGVTIRFNNNQPPIFTPRIHEEDDDEEEEEDVNVEVIFVYVCFCVWWSVVVFFVFLVV